MKLFLFAWIFIVLTVTAKAEAACRVDLIQGYYPIESFTSYSPVDPFCRDALRDCNRQRILRNLGGDARCVALQDGGVGPAPSVRPFPGPGPVPGPAPYPYPQPGPQPYPYPNPYPNPYPTDPYPQPYPQPYPAPLPMLQVGDTVFPYSWDHAYGAVILSANPYANDFRVKSNQSGSVYTFVKSELGIPKGCLDRFCVGDKVYPESWDHIYGANILAIYFEKGEVLIKSNQSGSLYKMAPSSLAVGNGCMFSFCVGQTVYPRTWSHSYGGQIIAINPASQLFTVKSNQSGSVYKFNVTDL